MHRKKLIFLMSLLISVISCATPGRMSPKDPVAFDVAKSCSKEKMDWNRVQTLAQGHEAAKARGECAEAAIKNGDENRDAAQYNKDAAIHNSPDGFTARMKVFLQGLVTGVAVVGMAVATHGGSLAPVILKLAVGL